MKFDPPVTAVTLHPGTVVVFVFGPVLIVAALFVKVRPVGEKLPFVIRLSARAEANDKRTNPARRIIFLRPDGINLAKTWSNFDVFNEAFNFNHLRSLPAL